MTAVTYSGCSLLSSTTRHSTRVIRQPVSERPCRQITQPGGKQPAIPSYTYHAGYSSTPAVVGHNAAALSTFRQDRLSLLTLAVRLRFPEMIHTAHHAQFHEVNAIFATVSFSSCYSYLILSHITLILPLS